MEFAELEIKNLNRSSAGNNNAGICSTEKSPKRNMGFAKKTHEEFQALENHYECKQVSVRGQGFIHSPVKDTLYWNNFG